MLYEGPKQKKKLLGYVLNNNNYWRFDPAEVIGSGEVAVIRCHWHAGRFPDPARHLKKKGKYECDQQYQTILMSASSAHENSWNRQNPEKSFGSANLDNSTFARARESNMTIQDSPSADASLAAAGKDAFDNYNRFSAVFNSPDLSSLKAAPGEWADPKLGLKRGLQSWKEHDKEHRKKICTIKEEESSEEAVQEASASSAIAIPRPEPSCPRRSLPSEPAPEEFEQASTEPTFRRFRFLCFQLIQQDKELEFKLLRKEAGTLIEVNQDNREEDIQEDSAAGTTSQEGGEEVQTSPEAAPQDSAETDYKLIRQLFFQLQEETKAMNIGYTDAIDMSFWVKLLQDSIQNRLDVLDDLMEKFACIQINKTMFERCFVKFFAAVLSVKPT